MKRKRTLFFLIVLGVSVSLSLTARKSVAHCQIPCGIYDDHARVKSLYEDAATIEKAMSLIRQLAGKTDPQSQNQLVRWIMNKERHAQNIITTVSDYFLAQRVHPDQKDYLERLKEHHAVLLAAMKVKQHADMAFARELREKIAALASFYP